MVKSWILRPSIPKLMRLFKNIPRETVSSSSQSIESKKDLVSPHLLKQPIKPFGYDIFANVPQNINVLTNITVPSNIMCLDCDEPQLFFGKINKSSIIEINRDGFVQFRIRTNSFGGTYL